MHFDAHSFLAYALNANSLVNPGKLDHINKAILAHQPHAFVISETKTNQHHGNKLPTNKYNIFKEVGVRSTGFHTYKWGVVVGVWKDIQIS